MQSISLGQVERIDPRRAWPHEALNFTPWLAEHLDDLAKAIGGVELELGAREFAVGDFSADLIGTELGTGAAFVIENQLADTDHGHLGQIITYASGLNAQVMVWVAPRIREEHRRAIDWLNEVTREEYSFFAVRVELLRIGQEVAPDFVVVASPNTWQKTLQTLKDGNRTSSVRGEAYRRIWTRLLEKWRVVDSGAEARKAQALNWLRLGGNLYATFSTQGPRIEVYLSESGANEIFDLVAEQRADIESAFGSELAWEPLPGKQATRIALYTTGSFDSTDAEIEEITDWLFATAKHFREVLQPRVDEARTAYRAGVRASVPVAAEP